MNKNDYYFEKLNELKTKTIKKLDKKDEEQFEREILMSHISNKCELLYKTYLILKYCKSLGEPCYMQSKIASLSFFYLLGFLYFDPKKYGCNNDIWFGRLGRLETYKVVSLRVRHSFVEKLAKYIVSINDDRQTFINASKYNGSGSFYRYSYSFYDKGLDVSTLCQIHTLDGYDYPIGAFSKDERYDFRISFDVMGYDYLEFTKIAMDKQIVIDIPKALDNINNSLKEGKRVLGIGKIYQEYLHPYNKIDNILELININGCTHGPITKLIPLFYWDQILNQLYKLKNIDRETAFSIYKERWNGTLKNNKTHLNKLSPRLKNFILTENVFWHLGMSLQQVRDILLIYSCDELKDQVIDD